MPKHLHVQVHVYCSNCCGEPEQPTCTLNCTEAVHLFVCNRIRQFSIFAKQTRCISNNNNNSQSMAQVGQMKCGVYCVWTKGSTATSGNAESVAWMIIDLRPSSLLLYVHITSKMICHQPEQTMHVTLAVPWARQAKLRTATSLVKEATTATHNEVMFWHLWVLIMHGPYLKWTQLQCAWLVPYGSWSLIICSLIPSPQPPAIIACIMNNTEKAFVTSVHTSARVRVLTTSRTVKVHLAVSTKALKTWTTPNSGHTAVVTMVSTLERLQ